MASHVIQPPWRGTVVAQFPGIPAWGIPTSRVKQECIPVSGMDGISPEWAWQGADGAGVRVCIVDSGIEKSHPLVGPIELSASVVFGVEGQPRVALIEPEDNAGHGTACAGIVRSVAPKASISSMRVLTNAKTGTGLALLAGLEWAIEEGFDVINLSVSTARSEFREALSELADRAYFRRCSLIVSAHNMPVRSFPWPFASVLSVAAHDEPDPFLHYYNPAPPVEFYGRGVAVPVAWLNGGQIRSTGNSYAAPHVSGLCALILSKHPWLTPFQLKSVLFHTARNVIESAGGAHAND